MSLAITYRDLLRELGVFLAWGRDVDAFKPHQLSDAEQIIASGLRRFYFPLPLAPDQPRHIWSFLQPVSTLDVTQGVSTYDLPSDFLTLVSNEFTYATDSGQGRISRVEDWQLRSMLAESAQSGPAKYFAITTKTPSQGAETRSIVTFYPTFAASATLSYRYLLSPERLSDENPHPLGGAQHAETIIESVLGAAEKTLHQEEGIHEKRFRELLTASILLDKTLSDPATSAPWPLEHPASDLQVNKAYLKRLVGDALGFGPHPSLWDHTQANRVKAVMETGLRKFYLPPVLPGESGSHDWSFLRPVKRLNLIAGVYRYDLPIDCAMIEGDMVYDPGAFSMYPSIKMVNERTIEMRKQRVLATGRPTHFAYRPKPLDPAQGTAYEAVFDPTPDQDYEISYRCQINPSMLPDDVALPFGGMPHMQTVIEACLCAAEESRGGQGVHAAAFGERIRASVSHDRKVSAPNTLGVNYDPSDRPFYPESWHHCQDGIVRYNGQAY